MTDTLVLDAMMEALQRNPLTPERLDKPIIDGKERSQYRETDERPFYANREAVPTAQANRRWARAIEPFHDDVTAPRLERPRRGTCNDCGGTVHAVETRLGNQIRVDGRCLSCGAEVHRAGGGH